MKVNYRPRTTLVLAVTALLCAAASARADEIRVMTSGGFTAAYLELVQEFERATGQKVMTAFGASLGNAPDSIPSRLQRGEPVDVVILAASALDDLIQQGTVIRGSRVDLARSSIGVAVRAGAPKPDIGSVQALTQALLQAKSIAYSASASGVYVSTELFQRLGIADRVMGKSRRIESERVGAVIARGDAEIGFQQVSELLPIPGIQYLGPLPAEVQRVTVFSAGVAAGARDPEAARALIRFLSSPAAAAAVTRSGLELVPQGVVTQRNLSLALAKSIAEGTLAECKSKGFNTSAVVVDRAGQVLVMLRDEQSTAQQLEMARRKAYTARMFRITTLEFQKRTSNPASAAQRDIADVLALGGGVPIQVGSETIGGVGSAGSTQATDESCAKAGIATAADLLK